MLFNSIEYFVFLPAVFCLYWFAFGRTVRIQNVFLLIASYIFYGWWDWRFLSLIAFSSIVDYSVGINLGRSKDSRHRKLLLLLSIAVNIGFLAYFKYSNFFIDSFCKAFTFFGRPVSDPVFLKVLLPVGISFYTFQTLSYSIDCYRRKIRPTRDIIAFFAFVGFFPQLVAGPIERATNLLPQFYGKRLFKNAEATDGLRQIVWGLFKKVVIADNCATYANDIFANYSTYSGSTLFLGAVFFAFQIYGDFSGYSDIAIGTARLFGFNLMRNFSVPYFSRDMAEFWRRWHISLSTWFRDYIYIPLGGSRCGLWFGIRNIFIVFILSGLWHGANWTFVAWGAVNALYFLPVMLFGKNKVNTDTVAAGVLFPSIKEVVQMGTTFFLTVIAWVFFRSETLGMAFSYISRMFSRSWLAYPEVRPSAIFLIIVLFITVEWFQRDTQHALQFYQCKLPRVVQWCIYYLVILLIFQFGRANQVFIYFQF